MIMMDWPLRITALLFFVISWLYAWGLLRFFGDDPKRDRYFLWDWASVCGIFVTTSITYSIIWMIRKATGYQLTWGILEQNIWDLFCMFASALFAMRWVRIELVKRRRAQYRELVRLQKENADLKRKLQEAKKNCPDNLTVVEDEYTDFSFWVLETSRN